MLRRFLYIFFLLLCTWRKRLASQEFRAHLLLLQRSAGPTGRWLFRVDSVVPFVVGAVFQQKRLPPSWWPTSRITCCFKNRPLFLWSITTSYWLDYWPLIRRLQRTNSRQQLLTCCNFGKILVKSNKLPISRESLEQIARQLSWTAPLHFESIRQPHPLIR